MVLIIVCSAYNLLFIADGALGISVFLLNVFIVGVVESLVFLKLGWYVPSLGVLIGNIVCFYIIDKQNNLKNNI